MQSSYLSCSDHNRIQQQSGCFTIQYESNLANSSSFWTFFYQWDPSIGRVIRWTLRIFPILKNRTWTTTYNLLICVAPSRVIENAHMLQSRWLHIWMFNVHIRLIKSATFASMHPLYKFMPVCIKVELTIWLTILKEAPRNANTSKIGYISIFLTTDTYFT